MNCCECQELMPEYLEKVLPPEHERGVRLHLEACEGCRKDLGQAEMLRSAARRLPRLQPSSEALLKTVDAIYQSVPVRRRGEFGPVLDLDDLSQYLRVDRAVIEMYLEDLPHFELGGKLLFRRKSVDQWIEARERATVFQVSEAFPDSAVVINP